MGFQFCHDAVEDFVGYILMRHFASAETHRDFDLVAFLQKRRRGFHLDREIVIVDRGAQLDFLQLHNFLFLAGFGCLLLPFED